MTLIKKSTLLYLLTLVVAIFVFVKNAWVCEDAYIFFRSIEQLFAGNGPIWNPHERVQVFTSPLWFYGLASVRILSHDLYLDAIVVSLTLWIFTVAALKKIFESDVVLLITILILLASTGFCDYTSSGLENVLGYFFIAVYVLNYTNLFAFEKRKSVNQKSKENCIKLAFLSFGLIICVRHDLSLLLLPPTIYIVVKNFRRFSITQWIVLTIFVASPFILYSLFSLFYYGFPFPNTAYAKLHTGIHHIELFKQGIKYFASSLKYDAVTLMIIIGSLLLSLMSSSETYLRFLSYGVALNLLYVVSVGGDFMQGRFLSYAYLVSVIVVQLRFQKFHSPKFRALILVAICSYLILYPHTPFNSPLGYKNRIIEMGIADERGYYFDELSLYRYFFRDKRDKFFPAHNWARAGYQFKQTSDKITIRDTIGLFGYYSGIHKIIIDPLAISDPLLARMPVNDSWRVGHFKRKIPKGYVESIIDRNQEIVNPQLEEYNKKLIILTRNKDLFSKERLKTIVLMNIGAYNELLLNE